MSLRRSGTGGLLAAVCASVCLGFSGPAGAADFQELRPPQFREYILAEGLDSP